MVPRRVLPMMWNTDQVEAEEDDWAFFVEALQAWRAWRVIELDSVLLLESITYKVPWIPRQEMVAECRATKAPGKTHPSHLSPNISHGCGLYSVKTREDAFECRDYAARNNTVVHGRVSIWGNVFRFTKGYISEFAYPSYLYIPSELGEELHNEISPEELAITLQRTYVVETEIT